MTSSLLRAAGSFSKILFKLSRRYIVCRWGAAFHRSSIPRSKGLEAGSSLLTTGFAVITKFDPGCLRGIEKMDFADDFFFLKLNLWEFPHLIAPKFPFLRGLRFLKYENFVKILGNRYRPRSVGTDRIAVQ